MKRNGWSVRRLWEEFGDEKHPHHAFLAKNVLTEAAIASYLKSSAEPAPSPSDDQVKAIAIALGYTLDDPVTLDLLKRARLDRETKEKRPKHHESARAIEKLLNGLAIGLGSGSEIGAVLIQAFRRGAYTAALTSSGEIDNRTDMQVLKLHCNTEGVFLENAGDEAVEQVLVVLPGVPSIKWRLNVLAAGATARLTRGRYSMREIETALAEFHGTTQKQRYVQAMSTRTLPIAVSRPCLQLPRTWFDLNRFLMSTLAIASEPFPLTQTTEIVHAVANPRLRTNDAFGPIQATGLYADAGFSIERGPSSAEPVMMSRVFNRQLWDADISMTEEAGLLDALQDHLRIRPEITVMAVRARYVDVTKRGGWIANEEKVCLGSDLLSRSAPAKIFHGTYFHGLVTNELASQVLETIGPDPEEAYSEFGASVFCERDGGLELGTIVDSKMSNHLGASTLLVTTDGRIQLWRQGEGDQSVGLMTPTGSGSCDWSDCTNGSLTSTAIAGMEREAREESGLNDRPDVNFDTRLLAYYRWVRRGGKPEFVGISKVNIDSKELEAESSEVVKPKSKLPFDIDARTPESLISALNDVLQGRQARCSVPLWVALIVLLERCEERDRPLFTFLWGT